MPADARRKHMALFGGTGTGKSTLLMNMAASDLAGGTGITVVDPSQTVRVSTIMLTSEY